MAGRTSCQQRTASTAAEYDGGGSSKGALSRHRAPATSGSHVASMAVAPAPHLAQHTGPQTHQDCLPTRMATTRLASRAAQPAFQTPAAGLVSLRTSFPITSRPCRRALKEGQLPCHVPGQYHQRSVAAPMRSCSERPSDSSHATCCRLHLRARGWAGRAPDMYARFSACNSSV